MTRGFCEGTGIIEILENQAESLCLLRNLIIVELESRHSTGKQNVVIGGSIPITELAPTRHIACPSVLILALHADTAQVDRHRAPVGERCDEKGGGGFSLAPRVAVGECPTFHPEVHQLRAAPASRGLCCLVANHRRYKKRQAEDRHDDSDDNRGATHNVRVDPLPQSDSWPKQVHLGSLPCSRIPARPESQPGNGFRELGLTASDRLISRWKSQPWRDTQPQCATLHQARSSGMNMNPRLPDFLRSNKCAA
jgi:hypothetical protein